MFSLSVLLFSLVLLVPPFSFCPVFVIQTFFSFALLLCSFSFVPSLAPPAFSPVTLPLLFSFALIFCCFPAFSSTILSVLCHSAIHRFCHSVAPFLCHSEEVARPTKNLIQGHSERSKESISTLNFCERLAALFSFSCTFLCKKVPKSFCTVKMAASVFGRSLSGHGRLTLFRTPAPGAHSLDERNPAISTSAEQRFKCPHKNPPSFRLPTRHSVEPSPLCHSEEVARLTKNLKQVVILRKGTVLTKNLFPRKIDS